MQNYHKHSWFTNTLVADCPTSYEAYVDRARELGHKVISSVEHGFQSNYYVPYELVMKNNDKLKDKLSKGEITKEEYDRGLLKFVFGAEAYWVKDRHQKDRTNCHIVLLAKNEEGRRDINEALSDANIDGYYGQPRLDIELLLRIKPENVMVTTACLKYWVYSDIEEITVQLHNHFKDNFYLEIQYHNTEIQKILNRRILDLSYKYNIDIILGYDSHYIYEKDSVERNNYLEGRGIVYDQDEAGWYMDYPTDEVAIKRLREQAVLNEEEIARCTKNTDKPLEFDDLYFDKEIKLPSLYKDKTQEWKNNKLRELVYEAWDNVKKDVDPLRYQEYIAGIEYELSAIIDTNMADYFLDDYFIVKRGIEKGGIITKTGRGSGVSYYVNSLLGFSNIDRFISPVKLYPDRFISKTRILMTRSLPDLDLNLGTVEPFAEAQQELMGENHAYPMISYKPLQKSSAFKLYAKSQGLDFDIANEVTAQIKLYEKALKRADTEEEKEAIDLYDFVDKQYHGYLDESKKYQGIINAKSQAPCGYLIYDGDIKREIGLILCKSETTGKEVLTTVIDGNVAENYKFVKNDLLKVDIWLTINKIFEKIGIPTYSVPEITKIVDQDKKTWDIYANGYTLGVNQCESDFGRSCCTRYKPKNMQELTALVAALRPGFKTQLDNFLDRKPYTTGIKELDHLLEDSFHYIMYQENIMTYLGWLGIEQTETYAIIKKISKKKFKDKELIELKKRLLTGWISHTGNEEGFERTWEIVVAFSKYAFNASHAYSYAYDSVYGAYLKAHYPYEFYSVMLQHLSEKGKKDKALLYKQEMEEAFGIREGVYKFRKDNREFSIDRENGAINPSLLSLKKMSQQSAEDLYSIKDKNFDTFIDLLICLKNETCINAGKLNVLLSLDYFSEFGELGYLLECIKVFDAFYEKKTIKKDRLDSFEIPYEYVRKFSNKETETRVEEIDCLAYVKSIGKSENDLDDCVKYKRINGEKVKNGYSTKLVIKKYKLSDDDIKKFAIKTVIGYFDEIDMIGFLRYYANNIDKSKVSIRQKISMQLENLGQINVIDKKYKGFCVVTELNVEYSPKITLYALANGNTIPVKIESKIFRNCPLKIGDIVRVIDQCRQKKRRANGKDEKGKTIFVEIDDYEWWVTDYKIV